MKQPAVEHNRRGRILFVAEAVTLAHVARPMALALHLDPRFYDVYFACDPCYDGLLSKLPLQRRNISSVSSQQFLDALANGRAVYNFQTLERYARDDLNLLHEIEPDVVVGDFRLSLAVSARVASVPYVALCNAYWSPYARNPVPLPDLAFTRWTGVSAGQALFRVLFPVASALHARPLNRLRKKYGLRPIRHSLSHIYTEADRTLYADVRELVPTFDLPTSHRYIGPIIWSPSIDPPDWWDSLPQDRPLIYVTLGSSGQTQLLGRVLAALADLRVYVLAATAAKDPPAQIPVNAFVADYLPGSSAAERSVLVICNGGSPTTQQALSTGTPVLGIPSNMDQYLNMESVCRAGAGRVLRSGQAAVPSIRQAVEQMLHDKDYAKSAARVCDIFRTYDAAAAFQQVLVEILGSPGTQASRQCTSSYASHGNE